MNLAWLASVLQPYDVAPHPNFADSEYGRLSAPRLAATIIGGDWKISFLEDGEGESPNPWIAMARDCLSAETIGVAVPTLANRLMDNPPQDAAETAAFVLLLCTSAAELDDYGTCFEALDRTLSRLSAQASMDARLVRAALLQQKALRLCDAGQNYVEVALDAGREVVGVNPAKCSDFATTRGVSWNALTTIKQIRQSLIDAAASLVPTDDRAAAERAGLPDRLTLVRARPTQLDYRLASGRAEEYGRHIEDEFGAKFRTQARSFGRVQPDLFRSLLMAELMGDSRVYPMRRAVALLRLVRADEQLLNAADALRLLRHSGEMTELNLALRQIHAAGPLGPLGADARQILRNRFAPKTLRTVELRVLSAAADILSPNEARAGLAAIRQSLAAGGPPDPPLRWQIKVLRNEAAWVAAASLGRVSGASNEAALLLLQEALNGPLEDQLADQSMARALAEIRWEDVAPPTRLRWREFVTGLGRSLIAVRERVFSGLGEEVPPRRSDDPLENTIHSLNAVLRGLEPSDPGKLEAGVPVVQKAMTRIRDAARGNSWSMGSVSPADVAVGLAINGASVELWNDIAKFLLDSRVHRWDRSPAFERLARFQGSLPETFLEAFRQEARNLLQSTGSWVFDEDQTTPYPEALRFLASHDVMEAGDIFDAVTALAGRPEPEVRQGAALTVSLLAYRGMRGDLMVIALTLAGDHDAFVRGHAGRALAALSDGEDPLARVAQRRMRSLLAEDGVIVPRLVLRGIAESGRPMRGWLVEDVTRLAEDHPSWSVRSQARDALTGTGGDN